jgi:hypothetical protein
MEKRLKKRSSIASFASNLTKRNSVVGSIRGLSPAGPSAGPSTRPTSNQDIADARNAYRERRAYILFDFNEQREFTPERIEDMLNPLLSANGDIKNDFGILSHVANDDEKTALERILLIVYGVDPLVSRVDHMWVMPEDDGQLLRVTYNSLEFPNLLKRSLSRGTGLHTAPVY